MRMKQRQLSGNFRSLRTLLLVVFGCAEKQSADVSVAKPFEGPFAPVHGGQQLSVVSPEGVQRTVAASLLVERLTDFHRLLSQWGGEASGRQGPQITLIGRSGNLGSPVKIGHPAPQGIPGFFGVGAGFRGAVDL